MMPIPWNPSRKTLSEFSEAWLVVFGMVAAPLSVWRGHDRWAIAFWAIALSGRLLGLFCPAILRPIFLGMILASWPIGWVVSNLTLGVIYFGVVTPIGIALRLRRGDLLNGRPSSASPSYWRDLRGAERPSDYLRPY